MKREVRLERLLGHTVCDRAGRPIGRVEEVIADKKGDEHVVREYLIGPAALLTRVLNQLKVFGTKQHTLSGYAARWDQLDISDPLRPVLTCGIEDLRRL